MTSWRQRLPRKNSENGLNRRSFLQAMAAGTAAVALPRNLEASPSCLLTPSLRPANSVRVRGQVQAGGRGIAGVAVTDSLEVVQTEADGSFELITTADREFVSVSLPAGYRIPQNSSGTARFYQPMQPDSSGEMIAAFDLEKLDGSDDNHTMLVLADPQTENMDEVTWCRERTVPDVRAVVAASGTAEAFGVACGDIMYDHLELFPEYERNVSLMGIPFFQVLGNHDQDYVGTDKDSTATFTSHFGPRYYSFNRGAAHYVVLDDVFWHGKGYIGYLDAGQLAWLENDLALVEPGATVFIAAHIPVLGSRHVRTGQRDPSITISVTNRELLYRLLEPFNAHIVTGHTHESEHVFEHGVHEHVNGAVCGAWWSGPICADGTPCGYSVYDIRGSEVTWRYKSTGHDFDFQLRTYPHGADPAAPDEIVANVWDWDPEWRVVWYEGGDRRGSMAQRVGHDPLSVDLHTGPDLPPRRKWVEPVPTAHLFYAPAGKEADVVVETTDRFGRVYAVPLGAAVRGRP